VSEPVLPPAPSESRRNLRSKLLRALDRSPYEPYTGADEGADRLFPVADVEGYSGKQAADIVGISYRQLDYWARTDLIRPSVADARGAGSRRRYSYRNLLELKLVKTLLDHGIKLESIREGFSYLRDHLGEDVSDAKLVISGTSAVLVRDDEELIEVIGRYQGQGVLDLLAFDGVKEQVDAAIVRQSSADWDDESPADDEPSSSPD
jgi:DNA-binding transcriptional MerR regulator